MLSALKKSLRMRRKRIEVSQSNPAQRWRDGVNSELKFWEQFLEEKGGANGPTPTGRASRLTHLFSQI